MKSSAICSFYISVCCLHSILWVFDYPIIRAIIIVLYLLIPTYYMALVNIKMNPGKYIKSLTFLVGVFLFYGLLLLCSRSPIYAFSSTGEELKKTTYLLNIWSSLVPFFAFYYFSKVGALNENRIRIWCFVFFAIASISFFHNRAIVLSETDYLFDTVTNNLGYAILALIPLIAFFNKKPVVQYFLFSYCLYLVVSGMKRGAIFICILCAIFILYYSIRRTKKKSLRLVLICLNIAFVFFILFVYKYYQNTSDYFNYRLQLTLEGDTNGRNLIVKTFLRHFINESSIFEVLFGGGAYNTVRLLGQFAHNDWIEILINQGLFGLVVYLFYWGTLIKTWVINRADYVVSIGMALFIIIFFTKTFFSMSYDNIEFYSMLVLGYCIAFNENQSNNQQTSSEK